MWTGADGRISERKCIALFFSWKLVQNLDYVIQKWAADRSLAGVDSNLMIFAGVVITCLGLGSWQTISNKKIDSEVINPPQAPVIVQKAETVTTQPATQVETVNAENVETVNTQTTNIERTE